jgi:hypothetical protein
MRGKPGLSYSLIDCHNDWTGRVSAIIQVNPPQSYVKRHATSSQNPVTAARVRPGRKNPMLQRAVNDVDRTLTVTIETVDILLPRSFPSHLSISTLQLNKNDML